MQTLLSTTRYSRKSSRKNSRARGKERDSRGDCDRIQYRHRSGVQDDDEMMDAIKAAALYGDGFRKIFERIRAMGKTWNHKRVHRVYVMMKMNKRVNLRKRLPARVKNPLTVPDQPNVTWSIDFVSDTLQSHRKFRVLNIIDDFNREAMGQMVATSIPGERLVRMLEEVIWEKGKPNNIRCDNGPEFISKVFHEWCEANSINIIHIQPGEPTQNSYIERFNGSYRRGVLDAYIFRTLDEVRQITEDWMNDYNNERPHESLGNVPPARYRQQYREMRQYAAIQN